MEAWATTTVLLCIYGILKEIRPSEPYLTEYLEGPWLNFTSSQVNHEIYPVWTYSYLFCLFIVLLVTDFLRYKPVLVIEGISYIVTWSLLLWSKSLIGMQMMQAVYGVATSTEVAYFTYIYSLVSESMFQKVTSYARSALLFGRFVSGVVSQSLISTGVMDYHGLNYVSFIFVILAFTTSLFLPFPRRIIQRKDSTVSFDGTKASKRSGFAEGLKFMAKELKKCYSDRNLLLWSLWWAVATSGNIQVGNYVQPLWMAIEPTLANSTQSTDYNGAVEATHTLLSSLAAMLLGFVHIRIELLTEVLLSLLSLVDCGLLITMAWTHSIWIAYITYIAFRTIYQMMITIVSYQVAKRLASDTRGLIFGVNTFVALILQTIITLTFVDKSGLHLEPRLQFSLYAVYFGILAALFIVSCLCGKYRDYIHF